MNLNSIPPEPERAEQLFDEQLRVVHQRTDRLFAWLLLGQWVAAIAVSLWVSPRAWAGSTSSVHVHVWAALGLGGIIVAYPFALAFRRAGRTYTRHCIAAAQMLMGVLLIHLTGGRLETHFHVFGSLAFLAFYRDWRVLITATVVVAADHLFRGFVFPESVFGVVTASPWRTLEHAGWVIFEDCFLIQACLRGVRELRVISERQAELENTNYVIERVVTERTAELQVRTEQLQQHQQRTEQILETANDAFLVMDESGKVLDWNKQAEAIFGWTKTEAIGRSLADFVIPDGTSKAGVHGLSHYLDSSRLNVRQQRADARAVRRNGVTVPIELTIWQIPFGDEIRFSAFIHDITDRKTAEVALRKSKEAAESANRAKSEFLANMSHEIRTPMNGIIGMTQLALGTELTQLQREYLEMVSRSADSLMSIINDILDFSKIEAGKLLLDPIPFSLRDCVENLLKDLSLRAQEKNLELAYYLDANVPDALIGDPGRLRQVLINLIGNSVKFTERGEVTVHIKAIEQSLGEARLQFSVRDTGIGIAPEKVATIFQPFEQADNSMTRRFGGTGLGLSISSKLVGMMGGSIGVESDLGKGSTFCFDVPFAITRNAARRKSPTLLQTLGGLSVLVVDDNATNRRMLHDLLLSWNMRPTLASSGPEGLQALNDAVKAGKPFSLVLLDAMMPDMDGFTVAENIRNHAAFTRATVMMISSADREEDAARCRSVGIDSYLSKPVTQPDLFDAIVTSLQLRSEAAVGSLECAHDAKPGENILGKTKFRILLAEDNIINEKLARKILELGGHEVVSAVNGREALRTIAEKSFDLVLMDVQMPEMDGLEATKAIRESERNSDRHLPIVAMTAHALNGDRERCLQAGMDGYVPKPIDPNHLWREIASLTIKPMSSPEKSTQPADEVVDQRQMDNLAAMSPDGTLLRELVGMFKTERPRLVADVRDAIDRGDASALNRSAHSLKGTLRSLGAQRASQEAHHLEEFGSSRNLVDAATRFQNLTREIELFERAVNDICGDTAR